MKEEEGRGQGGGWGEEKGQWTGRGRRNEVEEGKMEMTKINEREEGNVGEGV